MSLPGLDHSECCCEGVEAAKKGHVHCLLRLQGQGRFLELHSPERKAAGEARKSQAWEAAVAACEAGQADVLAWLLSAGWPARVDVDTDPWFWYHAAQPQEKDEFLEMMLDARLPSTREGCTWGGEQWPRMEIALCRHAVANPDPACLKVLLEAGCRSEWICPLAALEGREEQLISAAQSGCVCGGHALYAAASGGCIGILETAHRLATLQQSISTLDFPGQSCILQKCLEAAAGKGSVDCVMALWRCLDLRQPCGPRSLLSLGLQDPMHQKVQRWELTNLVAAARSAARAGQLGCLSYILDQDPRLVPGDLLELAAKGRQLACMKLLRQRGCRLGNSVVVAAVEGGCLDCLRYVLDRTAVSLSRELYVVLRQSSCCEMLLPIMFAKGVFPQSADMWTMIQDCFVGGHHPLFKEGNSKSLKILVKKCGAPPRQFLSTSAAAAEGVSVLAYVRELGADWEEGTLQAARCVETLRYAREHGCPWGNARLSCFMDGLDRLKYAHANGCPYDTSPHSHSLPLTSFDVVRYMFEHMDRTWAEEMLVNAVKHYTPDFRPAAEGVVEGSPSPTVDVRVFQYLVRRYGRPQSGDLAQLADAGRSRAAALAQCFYRAGKYTPPREGRGSQTAALWNDLERCPEEIRHLIASKAQLVLPCGQ